MPGLSFQKTSHALRHFTMTGVLWAIYGPNATPAGAIFSGFALKMGLTESQIAFLVGMGALTGVWELFSFYATMHVRNRPRFAVTLGVFEITLASSALLVFLLPQHFRYAGILVLFVLANGIGHTVSPLFNSWLSNVLPSDYRGRYIGYRMFVLTIASMIYLYLASRWLDWQNKTIVAFALVFVIGWISGLLGYFILGLTPYPEIEEEEPPGFARSLLAPLRNRSFVVLASFLGLWTVAGNLAWAFTSIYMIKYLELPYNRIAVYTNISLGMTLVGYLLFSNLSQRYGSKPVVQLLIFPAALVPAMWGLTTATNEYWLIPLSSAINGLCLSGLSMAVSNLLYKVVPSGKDNSPYFACWNTFAAAAAALGPFMGGMLKNWLPQTTAFGTQQFSALQVIFLLATAAHVLPLLLSLFLREGETTSTIHLLGQFRGNLLSLTYNYGLYTVARSDGTKGEAMLRLGKSRSPLAIDPLLKGLEHLSHEVRAKAAQGLGEGRFPEAVEPLMQELQDKESDIRPEAATALGKIGAAQDQLFAALYDDETRVRSSAAMALGELGTPAAREALRTVLRENEHDRNLLPTLVEAASHSGDLRVAELALNGLRHLTAPIVRLQVINGICRVLGEKNHFYRLATADDLAEGRMREKMMARVRHLLARVRFGTEQERQQLRQLGKKLEETLDGDRIEAFSAAARELVVIVEPMPGLPAVPHEAAISVRRYLDEKSADVADDEIVVFLLICLTSLARLMADPAAVPPSAIAPPLED